MQLPIGWFEVAAGSRPGDGGTPLDEYSTTAHPVSPRCELRRWVRGPRYVRLFKQLNPDTGEDAGRYQLGYGELADTLAKDEGHSVATEDEAELLAIAYKWMAIGGYP